MPSPEHFACHFLPLPPSGAAQGCPERPLPSVLFPAQAYSLGPPGLGSSSSLCQPRRAYRLPSFTAAYMLKMAKSVQRSIHPPVQPDPSALCGDPGSRLLMTSYNTSDSQVQKCSVICSSCSACAVLLCHTHAWSPSPSL